MKRMVMIVAIAAAISAMTAMPCFSDYNYDNENMRVFEGKVTKVDVGKALITVKGSMEMEFTVSSDTQLTQNTPGTTADIRLSDIDIGDYVSVQYYRKGDESRVPAKVMAVIVEYKAKS